MVSIKPKITWKTIILPAMGLLAFIIYLYILRADIPEILTTIKRIDLLLYLLAASFVLVDTFFYALTWRSLLNFLSVKISILKSYLYVWYGVFIDIIIPAESISGEVSRVYLVEREQNGTGGKVVASLVTHRLISMVITVSSLLLGMSMLLRERQVSILIFNLSLFLVATTAFFLLLLILLCIKENWTLKIINAIMGVIERVSRGRWKIAKLREDVVKAARMFHDSMKEFGRSLKTLSTALLLSIFSWLSTISIAYLTFLSLKFQVEWSVILVTCSIVWGVKSIPLGVPFEVGLPEITMTTLYTLLSIPFGISAAATILNRILTVWLRFFIGFAAQQGLELKAVTTSINIAKTEKA
jgi:uncharacterized protein (TIRG00374 family)